MNNAPVVSLNAKGFMVAIRNARSRDEKISAINSYCGYNHAAQFADQELAATMQAKREINPIKIVETEKKRVSTGYVKGLPDTVNRRIQDLLGREKLTVEQRSDDVRQARNKDLSWEERHFHMAKARQENTRLLHIRQEINQLTKGK